MLGSTISQATRTQNFRIGAAHDRMYAAWEYFKASEDDCQQVEREEIWRQATAEWILASGGGKAHRSRHDAHPAYRA